MSNAREFADISSYQPRVNFTQYRRAGHRVISIKAGGSPGDEWQGDPLFPEHWRKAGEVGLHRIAYFFCRFPDGANPVRQADQFLAEYHKYPGRYGDLLACDFELQLAGVGFTVNCMRRFIARLKYHVGNNVIVYSSPGFDAQLGNPRYGCPHWVADYAQHLWNPGHDKLFAWQHTDGLVGKRPYGAAGIGTCDMSTLAYKPYLRTLRRHK